MNSTFKVVFNKARGALMVVNEVTSSVQAKGTKTVVATAVAAMIAGVAGTAMAAVNSDTIIMDDNAKMTITVKDATPKLEFTKEGGIFGTKVVNDKTVKDAENAWAAGDTFANKTILLGENNTISLSSNEKGVAELTITDLTGKGTVVLKAHDGVKANPPVVAVDPHNATLTVGTLFGKAGDDLTVVFQANAGEKHGETSAKTVLTSANDLQLGTDAVVNNHGIAGVVTLDVQSGADAEVNAANEKALKLTNVAFKNAGELKLTGKTVAFDSAYDGTAEANSGKLVVVGDTTLTKAFTDGVVLIGENPLVGTVPNQKPTYADVEAQFNGTLDVVGKDAVLSAETLYVAKALTIGNDVEAQENTAEDGQPSNAVAASAVKGLVKAGTVQVDAVAVNVKSEGELQAQTLVLNGATLDVATHTTLDEEGEDVIHNGKVTVEGDIVATGTSTVTNDGVITAKNVVVKVEADAAAASALSVGTTSGAGTLVAETLSVSGLNKTKTGTFTLGGADLDVTDPLTREVTTVYNMTVNGVTVGDNGAVALTEESKTLVKGDVEVSSKGQLTSTADTTLVVEGGLTLAAKDSAYTRIGTELSGSTTVGHLVNAEKGAQFADLTITGDQASSNAGEMTAADVTIKTGAFTNTGKIEAESLTLKGGSFENAALKDTAGTEGTLQTNLTVSTGDLTLTNAAFTNKGIVAITAGVLVLNKGAVYTSDMFGDASSLSDTDVDTITVNEGAVFNVASLNGKTGTKYDHLLLDETWELNGGELQVAGSADLTAVDVKVAATTGDVTLAGTDLNVKSLTVAGTVELDGGNVTAKTVTQATGGTLTVTDGTLDVAEKLVTLATGTTVGSDGKLVVTADALGMSVKEGANVGANTIVYAPADADVPAVPFFKGVEKNNGIIEVNGLKGTVTLTTAKAALAKFGTDGATDAKKGLVYLNGLSIDAESAGVSGSTVGYAKVSDLNGLVLDVYRDKTVTGVTGALSGEFGAVQYDSTVPASLVDNILVLTGEGDIVTKLGATATAPREAADVNVGDAGTFIYKGTTANVAKITASANNKGSLVIEAGKLNTKDVKIGYAEVNGALNVTGTVDAGKTYVVEGGELTVTGLTAVLGDATIDGSAQLNADVTATDLTIGGNVTIGKVTISETEVDANLEVSHDFTIDNGAVLTMGEKSEATVAGAQINGTAHLNKLTASGVINVGAYEVNEETGEVTSENGTLFVNELAGGRIFADPAWTEGVVALGDESRVYVNTVATAGTVHGGQASLTVLGTHDAAEVNAALEQAGFTQFQKKDGYAAVLYINGAAKVAGQVIVDGSNERTGVLSQTIVATAEDATTKAADTLTVINGASFGEEVVTAGAVKLNDVFVANAAYGQELKLTSGSLDIDGDVKVSSGRILEAVDVEGAAGSIAIDIKSDDDLGALALVSTIDTLKSYYVNGQNLNATKSKSALFNEAMMNENNGLSQIETAAIIEDVASIGATAGMASVTMDALSAFNDTVAQRTSILAPNAEGVTVWADVNGGRYEAKKLMDGAGYSSDIYAGVLGVDTTVACGAKIGAAITVGTGDTDSKNTVAETSMDSDFFGLSVYTAKQFGAANVAVDLGYMQGSNDVTVKAFNLGKFSADSDAFTLGVRGELLTKAGDFNVVPHAGLRWTRISVDSFEAGYDTDIDSMNVFQLPVGVTVSGEFEGAGFTWAPAFDLSFVPAFGDKDADMTLGIRGANAQTSKLGVQVIDSNPVQATIGIDATNGAWAFGLNYKLGVGTDSRMNNSFNANVRYTF